MSLDVTTLLVAGSFVGLLPGLLLPLIWLRQREAPCLLTWGVGHILGAVGLLVVLLRPPIPAGISIQIGNMLLMSYYSCLWGAVRQSEGRRLPPFWFWAAPTVWLLACQVPAFYASLVARMMLATSLASLFIGAASAELWRGRADALPSRWPLFGILVLLGGCYILRIVLLPLLPYPAGTMAPSEIAFMLTGFGTMLLTIASSFLFLSLVQEGTGRRHHQAARIDPLTGIANRRGFLEAATRCLQPRRRDHDRSAVLLLMDLDHFKQINDSFGHAVGDSVLRLFSATARAELGPGDLLGRLGGEEFAVLLPGSGLSAGLAVAERIRRAFAREAMLVDGCRVMAQVSIGLAVQDSGAATPEALLAEADAALYRAKGKGRNRVEAPAVQEVA